jgi:hypothetical protein
MADFTITGVTSDVMKSLELRAEVTGRPIQDIAREALGRGLMFDVQGRLAVAERIREMTPGSIADDSAEIIRRLRDAS